MKLATYQDGSRDGQLIVVSRDLGHAHFATGIASRLQAVLDDWNFLSPQLEDLASTLNQGKARHAFAFDPRLCLAPLPRAYLWANPAPSPSDHFLPPHATLPADPLPAPIAVQAALAAVTGDLPMGATPEQGLDGVRLLLLAQQWNGMPASFAPLAVTPDELGGAWRGGRVHLPLQWLRKGRAAVALDVAAGMPAPFGERIAAQARDRRLQAGAIVGSGALVNAPTVDDWAAGDQLRLELKGADGHSVFGAAVSILAGPTGA